MPELVFYPHPILTQRADAVKIFDATLQQAIEDLKSVMKKANALGLSACHIGDMHRFIVIDLPESHNHAMPLICINPVITYASPEMQSQTEGSVSMPNVSETVERPNEIHVTYQDMEGVQHMMKASGFLSACIQHEIDQLDGIFWLQRLSRLKRERVLKKYVKISRI